MLTAFVIVIRIIPVVINVAHAKQLTTPTNFRSSHTRFVPSLGGAALFPTLFISMSAAAILSDSTFNVWIATGMMLMFGFGLKDDLMTSAPKTKFLGQLSSVLFIIFQPVMLLSHLNGFLDMQEVSWICTTPFVLFFMLALVNAMNLIDGIDGLAAGVTIVISIFLGYYFYVGGDWFYVFFSGSMVGALVGFLIFNYSTGDKKIFLGDCGSLVLGFYLGVICLRFAAGPVLPMELRIFLPENKILALFFILVIPIFDTFRVILIRLKNGKSPFHPDRNHLHHLVLDWLGSHARATAFIVGINVVVLLILLGIGKKVEWELLTVYVSLIYGALFVLSAWLSNKRKRKIVKDPEPAIAIEP